MRDYNTPVSKPRAPDRPSTRQSRSPLRWLGPFWRALGPGVITETKRTTTRPESSPGSTSAGGQRICGTALLWLAPVTWPLMAAVQSMCARIGMVTGEGLMAGLRLKYPRPLLAARLFRAPHREHHLHWRRPTRHGRCRPDADRHHLAPLGHPLWCADRVEYRPPALRDDRKRAQVARVGALCLRGHGGQGRPALGNRLPRHLRAVDAARFARLGHRSGHWTTISPYLFFWQASQEVEEEKAARIDTRSWPGVVPRPTRLAVASSMSARAPSSRTLAVIFIILTTAVTLHAARYGAAELESRRSRSASPSP